MRKSIITTLEKSYKRRGRRVKVTPKIARRKVLDGALERIERQFPSDENGVKKSEVELMFRIVEQAIVDRFAPSPQMLIVDKATAKSYVKRVMPHAEVCGVDSQWIRDVLAKRGFKV